MKIGSIDVDGRRFPNLALMKISRYYKQQGHVVEGVDKEPYHAIADDIQDAMSCMVVSNKYQIEIKITAL